METGTGQQRKAGQRSGQARRRKAELRDWRIRRARSDDPGIPIDALARRFGVHRATIFRALAGSHEQTAGESHERPGESHERSHEQSHERSQEPTILRADGVMGSEAVPDQEQRPVFCSLCTRPATTTDSEGMVTCDGCRPDATPAASDIRW